jgi:uncharacterized protein (TIGR04255 family)
MTKKLKNAPVYYTVAQVQFNPILDLDSFLPAIQSKMRDAKFPDFKQEIVQRLVLPFGGNDSVQAAAPGLSRQARYSFGDIEGRTSFLLDTNALTFQTTKYDTSVEFLRDFLAGLRIVTDALQLAFTERIGLRYLDAIRPLRDGELLEAYLVPEVRGISQKLSGQLIHSVHETLTQTAVGQMVSRVIIRDGRIGLPEDLSMHVLKIDPRFNQWEGLHAIVDTDASYMQREAFDMGAVQTHLTALHGIIKLSFKVTVTDYAWAAWA